MPGLPPPDHSASCRLDPNQIEYYEPTGYRRIPLSTCQGGNEIDKIESHPCPGHQADYDKRYALSGFGLFLAIVLPFAAAGGLGYYAWTNWRHKLSGFGQIRLGEGTTTAGFGERSGGSGENMFVAIPVMIIAGAWAVAKATPLLASSLWRSAKGYVPIGGSRGGWMDRGNAPYTSRGAFSARRDDYTHVLADEDELLGDDLDDGPGDEV